MGRAWVRRITGPVPKKAARVPPWLIEAVDDAGKCQQRRGYGESKSALRSASAPEDPRLDERIQRFRHVVARSAGGVGDLICAERTIWLSGKEEDSTQCVIGSVGKQGQAPAEGQFLISI